VHTQALKSAADYNLKRRFEEQVDTITGLEYVLLEMCGVLLELCGVLIP